jgi:hypothetical protein
MLVVDGDRPDAAQLVQSAKERTPNVQVTVLRGRRIPSELAVQLIDSSAAFRL